MDKSKTWICFMPDCNFTTTKTENDLVDYRRSLGLARSNHLKKHGIFTGDLEQRRSPFSKNEKMWALESYPRRDERLLRMFAK